MTTTSARSIIEQRLTNFDAWLTASGARHRWLNRQHTQVIITPGDATVYGFLVIPPTSDDGTIVSRGAVRQQGTYEGMLIGLVGNVPGPIRLPLFVDQGVDTFAVVEALSGGLRRKEHPNMFTFVATYVLAAVITRPAGPHLPGLDQIADVLVDYERDGVSAAQVLAQWVEFGGPTAPAS
jgi:hypothetical protein